MKICAEVTPNTWGQGAPVFEDDIRELSASYHSFVNIPAVAPLNTRLSLVFVRQPYSKIEAIARSKSHIEVTTIVHPHYDSLSKQRPLYPALVTPASHTIEKFQLLRLSVA